MLIFCHSGCLADCCFGHPFLHVLLEGSPCLEIVDAGEQAVSITACLHVDEVPPDSGDVRVALNEVNKLVEVCAILFIGSL